MAGSNLLYLRSDSIGDHVLSACMLEPLRRSFSSARIIVVAPDFVAPLYERCPFIDEVVAISFRRFGNPAFRASVAQQLQMLKAEFCLSPAFSRTEMTDFLVASSQATHRIAHAGDMSRIPPARREASNQKYTRLIPSPDPWKLELARHADFLSALAAPFDPLKMFPQMWTGPADDEFAANLFKNHGLDPRRTVALFAGAQLGVRQYRHYGKAIAPICREREFSVIALGGREDSAINQSNLKDAGVAGINLSGQTTLRQAAAVLKQCRIAIGAETGLAHIACAVGTPHVILLGGGHFGRFMPYSPLTTVACLPIECFGCDWECRYNRVHCTWDLQTPVLSAAFAHALDQETPVCPTVFCEDQNAWESSNAVTDESGLSLLSLTESNRPPRWKWPASLVDGMSLDIWLVARDAAAHRMTR
jgi:ADP-heptose:LPS heptosyltransferase